MMYVTNTQSGDKVAFVEQGEYLEVTVTRGELSNKVAVFKLKKSDIHKISKAVS